MSWFTNTLWTGVRSGSWALQAASLTVTASASLVTFQQIQQQQVLKASWSAQAENSGSAGADSHQQQLSLQLTNFNRGSSALSAPDLKGHAESLWTMNPGQSLSMITHADLASIIEASKSSSSLRGARVGGILTSRSVGRAHGVASAQSQGKTASDAKSSTTSIPNFLLKTNIVSSNQSVETNNSPSFSGNGQSRAPASASTPTSTQANAPVASVVPPTLPPISSFVLPPLENANTTSNVNGYVSGRVYRLQSTCPGGQVIGVLNASANSGAQIGMVSAQAFDLSQQWLIQMDAQSGSSIQALHSQQWMSTGIGDGFYRGVVASENLQGKSFGLAANKDGTYTISLLFQNRYLTAPTGSGSGSGDEVRHDLDQSEQNHLSLLEYQDQGCSQKFNLVPVTDSLNLCLVNSQIQTWAQDAATLQSGFSANGQTTDGVAFFSDGGMQFEITHSKAADYVTYTPAGQLDPNMAPMTNSVVTGFFGSKNSIVTEDVGVVDEVRVAANQNYFLSSNGQNGVLLQKRLDDGGLETTAFGGQGQLSFQSNQAGQWAIDDLGNGTLLLSKYGTPGSGMGWHPVSVVDPVTGQVTQPSLPGTNQSYCRVGRSLLFN